MATAKDILYFDSQCPICSAEVERLSTLADEGLAVEDLHLSPDLSDNQRHAMLNRLHLKTAEGQWLTGLEANVRAWQHTKYRTLAGVMLWPVFSWLARAGYELWLIGYRYQRKRRAEARQCEEQPARQKVRVRSHQSPGQRKIP